MKLLLIRRYIIDGMNENARGKVAALLEHLRRVEPLCIYLFGSWARGEEDEASDLDVVVIMRTDMPFLERAPSLCRNLSVQIGAVDMLVYTPEEWEAMRRCGNAFAQTVLEEGRVVYEREG